MSEGVSQFQIFEGEKMKKLSTPDWHTRFFIVASFVSFLSLRTKSKFPTQSVPRNSKLQQQATAAHSAPDLGNKVATDMSHFSPHRKSPTTLPTSEEVNVPTRLRFWSPGMTSLGGTESASLSHQQRPFGGQPRLDAPATHKATVPVARTGTSPTGTADTVDEAEEGWHSREGSSSHGREPRPDVVTPTAAASTTSTTRAALPPFLPHRLLRRDMVPPPQTSLKPSPKNSSVAAVTPTTTTLGRRDSGNSLLSWARSRQHRFGKPAATKQHDSSDRDNDEEDDDDGSCRGYQSDDYQDDFQTDDDASDDDDDDSLETEDGGVIAIGLPAPTIMASDRRNRNPSPPPPAVLPPPRTAEEAAQRAVSQAVAESVAEEEHCRKTGEKDKLAGAVAVGAVIVRRTRNSRGSDATTAAAAAHDSKPRAARDHHSDCEIKDAIRRQMGGGGGIVASSSEVRAVRSTAGGGTGGAASAAAASAYAAQRSRQELTKLRGFPEEEKEDESGPSLAPATSLLLSAVATTPHQIPAERMAAAHYFAERSRQERDKQGEGGPSLAPATSGTPAAVPEASIQHLPPVRSAPGAYAATSNAGLESLKRDDGPTLAPAAAAAAADSTQQTTLSRAASDESAATSASGSWVAQAGIPVLPGAFAVEGIEAAQRRRDSHDSYDPEDPEVATTEAGALYDPARNVVDVDAEPLGLAASSRHSESLIVPTGLGDASILHVTSYVVGAAPTMIDAIDPFEAELQVVVEGAVIVADDPGAVDPKTVRRLRMVQGSILCLAIASVGLIIGALLGFRAAPTEEPLGWIQVGADIHGPREEPQVFFGQALVATEDGTRIVAAAPGMDNKLLLNVGQVAVFEAIYGSNGPEWHESSTIAGTVASPVAECSLALTRDGRRIVSGHPHLGRGVVRIHDASDASSMPTWDRTATIPALESTSDDGTGEAEDWFGYAVGVSGDGNVVVVGAPMKVAEGNINAGAVLLYHWVDTQWELWGTSVAGDNDNDLLGWSLAIRPTGNGYRVVAGGPSHNAEAGLVQIWDFVDGEWGSATTLTGNKPLNRFGEAVVLSEDGNTLVVGARGNAFDKGQVFVYHNVDGTQWVQDTHVFEGVEPAEGYGAALALSPDGTVLAIGAPQNAEMGMDAGKVDVFKRDATGAWIREGRSIHGNSGEEFGRSVALSLEGKRLVAGGPSASFDGSIAQAGMVRVYDRDE